MEMRAPLPSATLAALSIVAAALAAEPAAAAEAPRHELVFAHHSDAARQDYDIWRMCADGTQMASLVVLPGTQLQIAVSPDGDGIVYSSRVEGQTDLWRKPFGRGDAVNLTQHPKEDVQPAWSPDGNTLAFFSNRDTEKPELYLMDLESGALTRKTHNEIYESGASWSPDGASILFTRYFPRPERGEHEGDGEIVRLDLASGEETQLTRLGGYNGGVSHSPDGRHVTFHRVAEGRAELWIMDPDGTHARALTDTFVDEYSPEWSPDGGWIAFTAGVENDSLGTFDLWLMRPDGSERHVLNRAPNTEGWQKWRPGAHYCR